MTDPVAPTETQQETMSEAEFRVLLAENGMALEGIAFTAALQGGRNLRAQIAQLDAYLAATAAEA